MKGNTAGALSADLLSLELNVTKRDKYDKLWLPFPVLAYFMTKMSKKLAFFWPIFGHVDRETLIGASRGLTAPHRIWGTWHWRGSAGHRQDSVIPRDRKYVTGYLNESTGQTGQLQLLIPLSSHPTSSAGWTPLHISMFLFLRDVWFLWPTYSHAVCFRSQNHSYGSRSLYKGIVPSHRCSFQPTHQPCKELWKWSSSLEFVSYWP